MSSAASKTARGFRKTDGDAIQYELFRGRQILPTRHQERIKPAVKRL